MVYGSTPYIGMTPKKMVATLKVANDTLEMSALDRSTASMSHIGHYQVFPWETGPLTLLESITEVQTAGPSITFSIWEGNVIRENMAALQLFTLGGSRGMLPQEILMTLGVLRHILVDSGAYREAQKAS